MAPRKGYKKSHTGCLVCKTRRVKCDETRPQCSNCIRHGVASLCVYKQPTLRHPIPTPGTSIASNSSDTLAQSSSASSRAPLSKIKSAKPQVATLCAACGTQHPNPHSLRVQMSSEFPGTLPACTLESHAPLVSPFSPTIDSNTGSNLSSTDLGLLYHFIVSTSQTMTLASSRKDAEDVSHAWSDIVAGRLSNVYPFVCHSVCAVAAAQLGTEECTPLIEHHYRMAVLGISKELVSPGLSETNCEALFSSTAACNLVLMSKAGQRLRKPNIPSWTSNTPLQNWVSIPNSDLDTTWISFARGTFSIIHHSAQSILLRPSGAILRSYLPNIPTSRTVSRRTEEMLQKLERLCHNMELGPSDEFDDVHVATAYFLSVWNLRRLWIIVEDCCGPTPSSIEVEEYNEAQYPLEGVRKIRHPNILCSALCQYVIRTPSQFWDCLDKKRPRALIIFSFYSVCWEALRYGFQAGWDQGPWWVDGRAETDLMGVRRALDSLLLDGTEDDRKAIFDEWTSDVWKVLEGLNHAWWLDDAAGHDILFQQMQDEFNISNTVSDLDHESFNQTEQWT